ncbi:carboxypeptidase regulatory-like domain-containing protein [bacterium]|nr:carboxypeptidase regulatory-like domain-containing protein [bacterium]
MRVLRVGLVLALIATGPAHAATVWGASGLSAMPDARTLKAREFELGARAVLPADRPGVSLGFLRIGFMEGLEGSLLYAVPDYAYLSGGLKYQLMRPSAANPTAIAVGLSLIGVDAAGPLSGLHYTMVLSRDLSGRIGTQPFNWGTLHLGFDGDVSLNTRLMAGLEVPFGPLGRVMVEGHGPQATSGAYTGLGVELTPLSWLRLSAGSLSVPGLSVVDRGFHYGASVQGMIPEFGQAPSKMPATPAAGRPQPAPSPRPSSAPGTIPVLTGPVTPPALPAATLLGRVLGADGTPRAGYAVSLAEPPRRATTTATGYFYLPALTPGTYPLEVYSPSGEKVALATASVQEGGPVSLTIQVGAQQAERITATPTPLRRGAVEGAVTDAATKEPLAGVRLFLEGTGVSVVAVTDAAGRFKIIDLAPGQYKVRAERSGYAVATATARIALEAPFAQVRLAIKRAG